MSLYDSARPLADITFEQLMERKFRAAEKMLGMEPAKKLPLYLPLMAARLESKCIIMLNRQDHRCPSCGDKMYASMRPVVEPPFISPTCWNRGCESNKNRREVDDNHHGYRTETFGT